MIYNIHKFFSQITSFTAAYVGWWTNQSSCAEPHVWSRSNSPQVVTVALFVLLSVPELLLQPSQLGAVYLQCKLGAGAGVEPNYFTTVLRLYITTSFIASNIFLEDKLQYFTLLCKFWPCNFPFFVFLYFSSTKFI